ncbi:MAG TPA: hypothetical protein VNM87_10780 [Candidatus Udaeobacter sp.]|nr:hypothetical protein [Candidatus Udaeobacter sp.]
MVRSLTRILVLALYLLQGGILLPLHHHSEAPPRLGLSLASGCQTDLPCSDPTHQHPKPPSEHSRTCLACAAAHKPATALAQVVLPTPVSGRPAPEPATHRPIRKLARRCRRPRAPPTHLPA